LAVKIRVVEAIRRAVEVSTRTLEISAVDTVVKRAQTLNQSLTEQKNAARLLGSTEGVKLIMQSLSALLAVVRSTITTIKETASDLQLNLLEQKDRALGLFTLYASPKLGLHCRLTNYATNNAKGAVLCATLFERQIFSFGREGENEVVREYEFEPTFRLPQEVAWWPRWGGESTLQTNWRHIYWKR
jgi:hypothetical protein